MDRFKALLSASRSREVSSRLQSCPPSIRNTGTVLQDQPAFPQFCKLPPEIRDQIWKLSCESRAIPLHVRHFTQTLTDIQKAAWDATLLPDDGDEYSAEIDARPHRPHLDYREYQTIVILNCTSAKKFCKCKYLPPSSPHTVRPPALFSVCCESRAAVLPLYTRYLDREYNARGRVVDGSIHPLAKDHGPIMLRRGPRNELSPHDDITRPDYPFPYITGVIINPAADVLVFDMNIAGSGSIIELQHLVAILAREIPEIHRVAVKMSIALRPTAWLSKRRFQYWKWMGQKGSWVPREVMKFGNLREVDVVINHHNNMLPLEWRERTVNQWKTEVAKLRWPEKWKGRMPEMKVVGSLEDLNLGHPYATSSSSSWKIPNLPKLAFLAVLTYMVGGPN